MKKLIYILAIAIGVSALLSGCLSLSTELSERGIVGALGIDNTGGIYKVTILCFNTDLAENAQSTFDVEYVAGQGADLHQALDAARTSTSKKLFFGHNTVLVLGRELAENKLYDTAVYLAQNKETRLNISVFMSDTTAEEIIKLKTSDKAHISGSIEKLAAGKPNGLDIKVQLFQITQKMPDSGVRGILPVLETTTMKSETSGDNGDEQLYDIAVNSVAVFDNSTLLGEARGDIMTGIFLIQNRVDSLDLTVRTREDMRAYAMLTSTDTKITVSSKNKGCTAEIICTGSVSVRGKSDFNDKTEIDELKILFEREVAYFIEAAYNYTKTDLKIDLFNIEWYMSQKISYREAERYFDAGNIPQASVKCEFGITG